MSRKVGQIIARGERRWLVRVYLGRDRETRKRIYHNRTIYASLRHAHAYLTRRLHERDLSRGVEGLQVTVDEFLDHWLKTAVRLKFAESRCRLDLLTRRQAAPPEQVPFPAPTSPPCLPHIPLRMLRRARPRKQRPWTGFGSRLPKQETEMRKYHETPPQSILPHTPFALLLWPGASLPKAPIDEAGPAARRGSASSEGIPGTPVAGRDAETDEPKNQRAGRDLPDLREGVHRLQRHRAGPQESERNGRSVERRSSRQYSSNALVVQWRKGFNQNG